MIPCRTASVVGLGALYAAGAIAACREPATPEVPPVTVARPSAPSDVPALTPSSSSDEAGVVASPVAPPAGGAAAVPVAGAGPTPDVAFLDELPPKSATGPWQVTGPICSTLAIVAARGGAKVGAVTLGVGDIYFVRHPGTVEVRPAAPNSLVVRILHEFSCAVRERPPEEKTVIRAAGVPEVKWAGGTMRAHLDLRDPKTSPELYIGRLEGTAAVAEHDHPTSSETLIAIEAAGTFTLHGKEQRLGPKQIVVVPSGTKHAWKPDPGSKLVAIQVYAPPGPEQRFLVLADAGSQPQR